jgi:putative redox protein
MVQIKIVYAGGLRCRAAHGPSGAALASDAPLDNQGRGESVSPTDLVATALGTCMATTMGIVAQRHGWDLTGMEIEVVKKMVADPIRRIGELAVTIRVPKDFGARERAVLERTARTCPVEKSLAPAIAIPVTWHWGSAVRA